MESSPSTQSQLGRQALRSQLVATNDVFITKIPKVELHVHIEGTLTPELRWKLAKRNDIRPQIGNKSLRELESVKDLRQAYDSVISSAQLSSYASSAEIPATFFQAYYSGCEVLKTRQDFFDLAFDYFKRAAAMNIRYAEIFFDPQSHTSRGVSWTDLMEGLRGAQQQAAKELDVKSGWIMCFLRDSTPESAMKHYQEAMQYKDMIIGFGLDSDERDRPPCLFNEVFSLARRDGFKITAHCDVGQKDTLENIRQVASTLGGTGADRVDHGLNAADTKELTTLIVQSRIGITLCPWAYLRRWNYQEVAERLQILFNAGARISISSDSPAYMDDSWVLHNLLLTKQMCRLSDEDVTSLLQTSIETSWARDEIKADLLVELQEYARDRAKKT